MLELRDATTGTLLFSVTANQLLIFGVAYILGAMGTWYGYARSLYHGRRLQFDPSTVSTAPRPLTYEDIMENYLLIGSVIAVVWPIIWSFYPWLLLARLYGRVMKGERSWKPIMAE